MTIESLNKRLARLGDSASPLALSVCRTKDCIFFHDQDDQFFRDFGLRSTTRLKHEDLGGALLNSLSASLHLAP
jgi:hypothetical protein